MKFLVLMLLSLSANAELLEETKWEMCTAIVQTGSCDCRRITVITKNGKQIGSPEFFRKSFSAGDSLSELPKPLKESCQIVATPEKIKENIERQKRK